MKIRYQKIEAQKNFYPGYQIVSRGIFYGGRMISSQLNTEFEIPDYDGLKKVYSIWICVEAPRKIGNSISTYSLEKRDIVPGIPDNKEAYDKLSVVMICLNEKAEKETDFLKLMNTLLSETKSVEDKKWELEEKFHISMKSKMEKELNLMCNLSDLVEERGMEKKLRELVSRMFHRGWSVSEIAEAFGESVETIQKALRDTESAKI